LHFTFIILNLNCLLMNARDLKSPIPYQLQPICANMDTIPAELVDRISSYLEHNDLKNTLLVSKSFRHAAEKYSGAFYQFRLHEETAEKFLTTFSGHRFSYLRDVEFWIDLPRIEYTYPLPRDDAEQLQKNDESLTRQINLLFETIKTAERRAREQNHYGKILLKINAADRWASCKYLPLGFPLHLSWRVHLLEPEKLPMLDSIRSLEVRRGVQGGSGDSDINKGYISARVRPDYRIMVDLAVKCPNLEFLGCCVGGDEWQRKWESTAERYLTRDWAGPRRDTRRDFSIALEASKLPRSLRRINLDFLYDLDEATMIDHLNAQPNMVLPAANDPFSISLSHLSHQLRHVNLRVVTDESLFWPEATGGIPWPSLETFIVMFHMVSPSGTWYFQGFHGEGGNMSGFEVTDASYPSFEATEEDNEMVDYVDTNGHVETDSISSRFRIVPNDNILRPFLEGFARATSQMRMLKEAALYCPLSWQPEDEYYPSDFEEDEDELEEEKLLPQHGRQYTNLAWGIYYRAPGQKDSKPGRLPSEARQLWWMVSTWRPDPELHELFQQIGRQASDDELIEHWFHDRYGETLVHRWYFEGFLQDVKGYRGQF
jgi:hypothetical protein